MATEGPSSSGPRYAPDDPTLPPPWKGLIDGSTEILYYWNPDTNVTQYEKPAALTAALTPPLPLGPHPTASTPKLAPIPVTRSGQSDGMVAQHVAHDHQAQQMNHFPQQRQTSSQQHGLIMTPNSEHQGAQQQASQVGQAMQQPSQFIPQQVRPQMMQHPGQHGQPLLQQAAQPMQHQAIHEMPQQLGQQIVQHQNTQVVQHQNTQVVQQQPNQYVHQQLHYASYQQNMFPPGQSSSQQKNQLGTQGQQYTNQQEYMPAFSKRDEVSPSQNLIVGNSSGQMPQTRIGQSQHVSGPSPNMQQHGSIVQPHPTGMELVHHQHVSRFSNQMGPTMPHQQSNAPPFGSKKSYEDNLPGRAGSEYYSNANKEGLVMGPQQHNPAAMPSNMRMGGISHHNVTPGNSGALNSVVGQTMHTMYSNSASPFSSNASMRAPLSGSSDAINLPPVEAYRQQHEITTTGDNVPAPFMTFEATGFPPELLREIHTAGFLSPTPIQAQSWPIALQSRDIVAIAKTGSGKTLGYLIPAFVHLRQRHNNSQNGPTVLVLAPTRELATQIQDEACKFGRSSRVSCTCLYGGAPKGPQLKELERGTDIVVATPGRLNDILEMRKIDFRQVSLLVLDEADRMLDMGFEPQIRKIVNEIPPRRQTLMYTATWPKEVRRIASDLLVNPVQVNIGNVDELAANKSITQYVEVVPQMDKERRLDQILRAQERGSKVIIFCSTKRLCDQLARSVARNFGAVVIHGDKSQGERDWVLSQFRSGKSPILVATDVAARGLDIKDIRVVINYDFPTGVEDYVHRIGRTGRAGATGVSYTFFSEQDWKYAADLVKVLEGANQHVPPQVREMALRGGPSFGKDRGAMNRFDSGGVGRWDSLGRNGVRDSGFGGRGGMRDSGFGGRGGMRDRHFGGRGGTRDDNFGGRGGMRDENFGGRGGMREHGFGYRGGMRDDPFSGRGSRGRGFGGPGHVGWGRNERGPHDRYGSMDGRGRSRGRFDNRRDDRTRGRSDSRSPERVRTWGYSRSRSRSRSWSRSRSRSRSRSWSRSRSRSLSQDRSIHRNSSPKRSQSRNRSCSPDHARSSKVINNPNLSQESLEKHEKDLTNPELDGHPESEMPPPRSPCTKHNELVKHESVEPLQLVISAELVEPQIGSDPVG